MEQNHFTISYPSLMLEKRGILAPVVNNNLAPSPLSSASFERPNKQKELITNRHLVYGVDDVGVG